MTAKTKTKATTALEALGRDRLVGLHHEATLQYGELWHRGLDLSLSPGVGRRRADEQADHRTRQAMRVLDKRLGGTGVAAWATPRDGHLVELRVPEGCARHAARLADEAGITLSLQDADERDRIVGLDLGRPTGQDLEEAIEGIAVCVRLAAIERVLYRQPEAA